MRYAVLFPGQGSQYVGMGSELFDVRPDLLGDPADRVLGWSLRAVCMEGPEEELTRTERAQPALYALAFAVWEVFREQAGVDPVAAAGHSLGEYTALAAAHAIAYLDGLALVRVRGAAMAAAADAEPSGMAALLGVDIDLAERIAHERRKRGGRLWVANDNAPGQVVVAGGVEDIEWLSSEGRTLGVRRSVPLNVAGAFHSPLMAPASDALARAVEAVDLTDPAFPVLANTSAAPHVLTDMADVLIGQVTGKVRFSESLRAIAALGVDTFVHVGPGDVTAGMARRAVPGTPVLVVNDLTSAGEVAAEVRSSVQ